jgi:hypothetical protein
MDEQVHVARLSTDLRIAAATLSDEEARFLVDAYYIIQEDRKRSNNQVRALDKSEEPHLLLTWFAEQNEVLESQLKTALGRYAQSKEVGKWMLGIYGIGPVISAGLIAHIDIKKCPTVGHIWRFAGLDPSVTWGKGEKRPWNASLKTLTWKIGQSFMKFSNAEDCYYGRLYRERKAFEVARNDSGGNAARAAELLPKFNKSTEAYKHLLTGKLPPAQIDGRARRWVVKLFLSHLHSVWWEIDTGEKPPKPYILTKEGGHAHEIKPPNWK